MGIGDKIKDYVDQGLSASKDFVNKAGAKAQDLGEKGVLKLEVMQLQGQAQKLIEKLGTEVYETLVSREQKTISKESPVLRDLLREIAEIKESIAKREEEMRKS